MMFSYFHSVVSFDFSTVAYYKLRFYCSPKCGQPRATRKIDEKSAKNYQLGKRTVANHYEEHGFNFVDMLKQFLVPEGRSDHLQTAGMQGFEPISEQSGSVCCALYNAGPSTGYFTERTIGWMVKNVPLNWQKPVDHEWSLAYQRNIDH